jgi:hypothetical protein
MKTATLLIAAAVLTVACGRNAQPGTMTLNGCLQAGEQGLASDPSRPAENVDRFVLADANTPAGSLYVLDGDKDELRQHVGHQVEVTGKLEDTSTTTGPRPFDVDSLKMIAATCAG